MNRAAIVHRSGLHRLFRPIYGGLGTIFMMHRVVTAKCDSAAVDLTITADFLERAIIAMRAADIDFVSMDEVKNRIVQGFCGRRFAALTFDDGYRDSVALALPVLQRLGVPTTIYVTTAAPDRTLDVWWLRLEEALRRRHAVSVDIDGVTQHFSLANVDEKATAYRRLVTWIHDEIERNKALVNEILRPSLISDEALCEAYFLGWDELRKLTANPLATIGAHTMNHHSLAELNEDRALAEMVDVRRRLTRELGIAADHFAYPFGSSKACGPREFEFAARAGYSTAVTTRKGNIFPRHADHPTALPRYILGGSRESVSDPIVSVSGASIGVGRRWRDPVVTA
jgi:peptidoglycan/xylan/chitin deacetylase (PgdA/CDA1 family)